MRFRSIVFLTGAWASSAVWAQDRPATLPPGSPVIRTETRLVLVDAVVTDKKGSYIGDLEMKNFRVWEDNKEQPLKTFSFGADPAGAAKSKQKYLVLFFDNSSMDMGEQARARMEAAKFIDKNKAPDHLMAIVNFNGSLRIAQNFTADAERLKEVAGAVKASANTTRPDPSAPGGTLTSAFAVRSVLLALRSLAKNLTNVPGRKSLVLFTSGFPLNQEGRVEENATIDACNKANVAIYPVDVRGLMPASLAPAVPPRRGALLDLPGMRGNLGIALAGDAVTRIASFFAAPQQGRGGGAGGGTGGNSPGGASGRGGGAPPSGGTTTAPPAGGVTGNPGGTSAGGRGGYGSPSPGTAGPGGRGSTGYPGNIGPGGYSPYPDVRNSRNPQVLIPTFPESSVLNQQVLYELATGTGGFVIVNTNDLLTGLEKIGQEQEHYYVLGYTPPESAEGSCHTLRVKIADRGGLNVRARSGYCNVKSADVLAGKPVEKQLESRAAGEENGIAAPMQAPFFYTAADTARVNVTIEIPSSGIKFEKVKGKYHAEVNVLGMVYRQDAGLAARFSDSVKLDFENKGQVEKFEKDPYHYENQFDVASGDYRLQVVFSSGGESFGKLETPLKIEPYDGKKFAMSAVALCGGVQPVGSLDANLDSVLLEGRTPLISGNMQFIPAGLYRFKSKDAAGIYVEVYEPALLERERIELAVQLRMMDRNTGQQLGDSGFISVTGYIRPGSPTVPVGLKLPVSGVPAGAYRLEVKSVDADFHEAVRTVDFDIAANF